MNVAQKFEMSVERFPSTEAIIFENKVFDYAEVDAISSQIGHILRGFNIQPGDRVAIFLPNIPDFIFSYLGALKLGAIAVSINSRLKYNEVKLILEDCQPKVVISSTELLDQIPREYAPILLALGDDLPVGVLNLDELKRTSSTDLKALPVTPNTQCSILYTSGTTGTPKGVVLSHGNIISNVDAANKHCGAKYRQRMLLFVPLFHCFGQNAVMNCAFAVGATIILHRRFQLNEILESIVRDQVTNFYAVPTIYIWLINMDISNIDLSPIRYYFSAAAKMPQEVAQKWHQITGLTIYEGYGLTETSPFSSYNHEAKYKLGSVGTPIQHVEMGVVDEYDNFLQPGEIGELVVRGPNVMLGYWNRSAETAQVIRNGWFHTGDVGTIDNEGYFYITDRLKDMINVSGMKVYPVEVENVYYQHPSVAEVAVYGLPDESRGEAVHADIVLKSNIVTSQDELIMFCKQHIADYKVPKTINFVESIPKSATGKVLKREIVAQAILSRSVQLSEV